MSEDATKRVRVLPLLFLYGLSLSSLRGSAKEGPSLAGYIRHLWSSISTGRWPIKGEGNEKTGLHCNRHSVSQYDSMYPAAATRT